ncbi:hypothetical protein Rumeso_02092 [Rubellimicrobium mesophilum DSM 19309]|uniref:Phasin domain-containing protein n=1 Tax=Rubellimicrobium mesophilum DSM 19309 TaxID=442562 RepID=A0A017HRD8_9RHOB|nr:hypothetical protein [Rubellimicrobium mesophilum]EYD76334.1 hypothetical protein Rumeso_02092 [Rubellimicrobium mesophilum DSM 19309]
MTAANNAWAELMKAGFGMASTGLQVSEMMVASSSVIGARMTILGQAARCPAEGDYAEITGMVAEKVVAVSKANQALVDQWSVMLADASEQVHHLGQHALRGRPLSVSDCSVLAERCLAHGTRMVTRTMEAGGLALAPVHQQATANARRLSST